MPQFIVLRLTPAAPVDAATFTKYLDGLTVKVYEISYANPKAGKPGDPTPPIGSATYNAPGFAVPQPVGAGPYVTYPANTTIAQHYSLEVSISTVIGVNFESVATALIEYAGGGSKYVAPDLRVEFDHGGVAPLLDVNAYYDVALLNSAAPDPSAYQGISPSNVSAYLTLQGALDPSLAQLQLAPDGTPPNYDTLKAAATTVLTKDPGGAPTEAEFANLTLDQCRNVAYEIVYGPQLPLPTPTDSLENMYTKPPNDGGNTNSDEQSRQGFQGNLNSYYSTRNAIAERLTSFLYSLSCAIWCELQTRAATEALITFAINPGTTPPGLATVADAAVIVTGALGVDVPAEYFYALTAQMPVQITPKQRYQMATTTTQAQVLTQLTDAVDAGMIVMPPSAPQPAMNPAQASRGLMSLAVPTGSSAVTCPVALIQPIWTDWLAYPVTSPPANNWRSYATDDDETKFWPAEALAQPPHFLEMVLFVLTQGYVVAGTATLLADEIKASLTIAQPGAPPPPPVQITQVSDLAKATAADWTTFFSPGGVTNVNLLPPFTMPGTPDDRVKAFIHYVQKFFDIPAVVPVIGTSGTGLPTTLPLPAYDLLSACFAGLPGLVLGTAFTAAQTTAIAVAATNVSAGDGDLKLWLIDSIDMLNDLAILANVPGQTAAFQFSLMEALYARGFTSTESVADLSAASFQQALIGTVAYDLAATIYTNAGIGVVPPGDTSGSFSPINRGALTNCIPPLYLSPLGPVEYLAQLLQLSENSTCAQPDNPPGNGHLTLGAAIATRRGDIGSMLVSEANLETPLPRIDLVNECLEFMVSETPTGHGGVIYNTSSDAIAGHLLCSEDVCCSCGCNEHETEALKEPKESCHKAPVLFGCMPEYSSPATPIAANGGVLPAAYNKLKVDFSGCCQPYSQALDVSRTYLRYLHTCRYETMRSFRRCITEFVLDPVNEPLGFASHMWRYPVRIEIAMEYLGISPEVYETVFAGAAVKPCGVAVSQNPTRPNLRAVELFGSVSQQPAEVADSRSWEQTASQLPEFLQRMCLGYCDFYELWKVGVVPFRNGAYGQDGSFPICEPCCLGDYSLEFSQDNGGSESGLYQLAIFLRVRCILKDHCHAPYTFAELQDFCEVLHLFVGGTVNPEFIRQLAAFQMLRNEFRMSLADKWRNTPPGATGADRMHLLALWVPGAAAWDFAVGELIRAVARHATTHFGCGPRPPEFEKLLTANLDPLSMLAGFDPAVATSTWHALPTHTIRFVEVLAKIYASDLSIGELLYLTSAGNHLDGDDPFPLQDANDALDLPLGLPEEDERFSLWHLRHTLLEAQPEGVEDCSWERIFSGLQREFGFASADIRALGEHFFPGVLERSGFAVSGAGRRFVSALNAANTVPAMWNALPRGPFQYDETTQQLWTELPIGDGEVMDQLTRLRSLETMEEQAFQDLYFQPRTMLSLFALLFSNFAEAERRLIEEGEEERRWVYFRDAFVLCRHRANLIAEHLAKHVEAATGQRHPKAVEDAHLLLRALYADENGAAAGSSWESDGGGVPPVMWNPAPNGGAYAALLGLTGTGSIAEYKLRDGTVVWRESCGAVGGFGWLRDRRNCPVPTIIPNLHVDLTTEQKRFVSAHNGFAIKDANGEWLGGAEGFRVTWEGALLVETEGSYEFTAFVPGERKHGEHEHDSKREDEDLEEHRHWRVTLRRGQKKWVVVSHQWHGERSFRRSALMLRQGAYELSVEYLQPDPEFLFEDRIAPLSTGFEVQYRGPDSEDRMIRIPHDRLYVIKKDQPLGVGVSNLTPAVTTYLNQVYISSLRDIRRTYQRAYKALLFAHRLALSAHTGPVSLSELGYMLAHKDLFAGTSFFSSGGSFAAHMADFDFNLLPLSDNFYPLATDARGNPSPKRIQAIFDWWERAFDYDRVRRDVRERSGRHLWLLFDEAAVKNPAHPDYLLRHMAADSRHWALDLRFFQGQGTPVYQVTSMDLRDDRWVVRAWHADRWLRALTQAFTPKDITQARQDLWASDDPSADVAGEAVTGNANLLEFVINGCIEIGEPRRYQDLKRLNDGLRERARRALLAYLCGPSGVAKSPKEISEMLLIDVDSGLREPASRIDDAISVVQTFIQRSRLGLEPLWIVSKEFVHMWDQMFASFHNWEACTRRRMYVENWIDWTDVGKAEGVEAFHFLDLQLKRATLTIARSGGVDYWPDQQIPAHPGEMSLEVRQPSEMQTLLAPREGLNLLGVEERAGRPEWLTSVPSPMLSIPTPTPTPPTPVRGPAIVPEEWVPPVVSPTSGGSAGALKLPFWMESAVAMGTRFLRVAAGGYPPASTTFKPRGTAVGDYGDCVSCCVECGGTHAAHLDEYFFWLVDRRQFDAIEQDEMYDSNLQVATPWHDPLQLPLLLEWPSVPTVRLAWCRVHNGEFGQPRRSEDGIEVTSTATIPDFTFAGRAADSLYFNVTNTVTPNTGFHFDIADDAADVEDSLTVPVPAAGTYPGGLPAYPYFAYMAPGKRLSPWSLYTPALAIGHSLRMHCRYEAALKWYGKVADPLMRDNTWVYCSEGGRSPSTQRGAQVPRLMDAAGQNVPQAANPAESQRSERSQNDLCCDSTQITCAEARDRSLLLHSLETLLEWSDATLRLNSPEAFQRSRLILDTAAKIMGPTPRAVESGAPAAVQMISNFTPLNPSLNPRLLMLYERVDDRLAVLHAWMNARRRRNGVLGLDTPYFGDDPVREGWRSLSETCLDEAEWCLPLSPYRFTFLLARAREITGRVREIGSALLSTFEKADAEYLASMRARQERELATLGLQARESTYRDADWQIQALQKTKENRQNDRRYYAALIQNGLINNEQQYVAQTGISQGNRTASMVEEGISEAMSIIPDLFVGFPCEETWLPIGTKLSGLFQALARISSTLAEKASVEGGLDLTEANWDRRLQDWVHRVELLDIEIEQVELQILGAQRRRDQTLCELNVQQRQIENAGEIQDFMRDKFSSHAVYVYLQKEIAGLFYKTYEIASQAVRQAERACNFELGHTTRRFLPEDTWDNLHDGMLAGDKLEIALDRMEHWYENCNLRELELSKQISLRLNFPMEFLRLKITGRCEIEIPEWLFDADYPGLYMRRIKSLALTIPCVTGPYTGVHCRTTLLSSTTRISPMLRKPAQRCCNVCAAAGPYVTCPHDERVVHLYAAREAIATSTGRNDTSLFQLNFQDERYLPFEFHGAVSRWRIEMPQRNNFFDMDTLTDFVMDLNYTAREGGKLLEEAAYEGAQKNLPGGCWTFFDLPHDFPDSWSLFRESCEHEGHTRELKLRLNRKMFPYVPGRPEVFVRRMTLLLEVESRGDKHWHETSGCPCPEPRMPDQHIVHITTSRIERHNHCDVQELEMRCAVTEEWPELYYGTLETKIGPIAPHDRQHHEATFRFRGDVGRISRAYLFCEYSAPRCER